MQQLRRDEAGADKQPAGQYVVIYIAYGSQALKYQTILSVYTLAYQLGEALASYSLLIYTDADRRLFDKHLAGLPVQVIVLGKEQARAMIGPANYVYRIKPAVIKEYFATHQQNLFFLDSDTLFMRDPTPLLQRIRPGHSLMNAAEYNFMDAGPVEPLHWYTLRQGLKKTDYLVMGQRMVIPLDTMMWNSGVIGLSPAESYLVDDMLSLTDQLYEASKTFNVEQFAISCVLQAATQVSSTEDYIDHYWPKYTKQTYNARIPGFLKQQRGKAGPELYRAAFEFAQQIRHIETPNAPLPERISTRLRLILKVARKGYL